MHFSQAFRSSANVHEVIGGNGLLHFSTNVSLVMEEFLLKVRGEMSKSLSLLYKKDSLLCGNDFRERPPAMQVDDLVED